MEHTIIEAIETLIKERIGAIKNYDASRSNQIRNNLDAINVKLADLREGTRWNLIKNQTQQSHHLQI